MDRGYSTLVIKAIDDEQRVIRGIATTPTVDHHGDQFEVQGLKYNLPIPLLKGHDHDFPIGEVFEANQTADGIQISARISKGSGLDYVETAWRQIKAKLVRGLSVGVLVNNKDIKETSTGRKFMSGDWIELSAVTIPANREATILTVKEFDSGSATAPAVTPAVGKKVTLKSTSPKGKVMATFTEQKASFEAKHAANVARMQEIMNKSAESNTTLDKAEEEEYDNLTNENVSVIRHIERLKTAESQVVATAKPVVDVTKTVADVTDTTRVTVKTNVAKGVGFTRLAIAMAQAKGDMMVASEILKQVKDQPELSQIMRVAAVSGGFKGMVEKAATAAATTTDADWAAPLVQYTNLTNEFIDILRPQTIIGRMPGIKRVPFNVRIPALTSGSQPAWVGQGLPKPVSEGAFGSVTLDFTKIAVICVLTEELARFSNPAAEGLVRDMMIKDIVQFQDEQFVDPTVAAVGVVTPASITNGTTPIASAGTTDANIAADLNALYKSFILQNGGSTQSLVWIMSPQTAFRVSLIQSAAGTPLYPSVTAQGGTLFGAPVIVSAALPSDSDGTTIIVLANASEILLADDGQVSVDVSREASVQMNDAPSAGAQSLVSLWQNNMIGLRAERFINYKRYRLSSVKYVSNVNY